MLIGSGRLRKLAADPYGGYEQRNPRFIDTFADHPVFLAGAGAVAGGMAGAGAHALVERAIRRKAERDANKYYTAIGKSYDAARNSGADILAHVESDVAQNNLRKDFATSASKNKKLLKSVSKYKSPAIGAGALLGGMLAYDHFFG